jgi:hypothetical protein
LESASARLAAQLCPRLPADKVVAVLPFADSGGGVRRLGEKLADGIERQLLARKIAVVDRQHLNSLLAERRFQMSEADSKEAMRIASTKLRGADLLIAGKTTEAGQEILAHAKALSLRPKAGRTLASTEDVSFPIRRVHALLWYVQRPAGGDLPPLALRYEFVSEDARGQFRLRPGSPVRDRQIFKIRLQPNCDCYAYVFLYGSSGRAKVMFPHAEIKPDNLLRGGVEYEVPEGGTKWYAFDRQPGRETFYLVASYTPLADLDGILARMEQQKKGSQPVSLALSRQIRSSIEESVAGGMTRQGAGKFRPKGSLIRDAGIVDVAPRRIRPDVGKAGADEDDALAIGCATVVRKISFVHR